MSDADDYYPDEDVQCDECGNMIFFDPRYDEELICDCGNDLSDFLG